MRSINYLLPVIRRHSRNENYSLTEGIVDEQIIQYVNDAQDYLQSALNSTNQVNKPFVVEKIISLVASQEAYSIPGRLFYNKEIQQVEYSYDGQTSNYRLLPKVHTFNRFTYNTTYVDGYYVRGNTINVVPTPAASVGSLRVLFEGKLDTLDKRRGQITTVTGLTSTGFTSITLDSTADETSNPNLTNIDYICINDANGNVTAYNIPVSNYNTGTNVLTPGTFTFQTGETITNGSYVTFGKYSTTHSKLPDECEAYLIHYACQQIFHVDSSDDAAEEAATCAKLEQGILAANKSQTAEIMYIPQVNWDEWWY